MDPDRKLAERTAAGDERAFAELVERHREPLLRYVERRFNPELAEDAVQEALLSAHRAIVGGTVPVDTRAWLCTIAWRRALDLTRRERDALPLDTALAGGADDPEARAIQANELGRVVAAFTELPARQRKALALSALEGRSLEEIGDALDVAPDTAKSLVARSRRTLTHRLAAAELDCGTARLEMESAAARGVRLRGDITLHVQSCKACARAHRAIRRRRRVAALLPIGFLIRTTGMRDRLRDLVALNPAWDAQVGAAKMCTAACLSIGAAGAAAPAVTVVAPLVAQATPTPHATALVAHKKTRHRAKPTPTPTPEPIVTPRATPVWTATPKPVVVRAKTVKRPKGRMPTPMAGGGMSEDDGTPKAITRGTPTTTPVVTPVPTVDAG